MNIIIKYYGEEIKINYLGELLDTLSTTNKIFQSLLIMEIMNIILKNIQKKIYISKSIYLF